MQSKINFKYKLMKYWGRVYRSLEQETEMFLLPV